jgi:hypothetical protein
LKSSTEVSGSGQDKEGTRGESSANDRGEQNVGKGPEQVVVEQDKAQGKKVENRTEIGASF